MVMQMEAFENWKARVDELAEKALDRLRDLRGRVEELSHQFSEASSVKELSPLMGELLSAKLEARQVLRAFKFSSKGLLKEAKDALSKTLSPDELEDILEELEGYINEKMEFLEEEYDALSDVVGDLRKRFKRAVRARKARIKEIRIRLPEITLPDFGRIVEEMETSLTTGWSKTPSIVVSSIRLPRSDLNIIDALVEAGIFRSRNEGIAFFVHRGIESSREWLERVKSKIEEIRRLREETRKELEKIIKEEEGGESSKSVKVDVE